MIGETSILRLPLRVKAIGTLASVSTGVLTCNMSIANIMTPQFAYNLLTQDINEYLIVKYLTYLSSYSSTTSYFTLVSSKLESYLLPSYQ